MISTQVDGAGQCGFNQAASRPADPIKRHRARRERRHPKAMLTTQTCSVALDLLENTIGGKRPFAQGAELPFKNAIIQTAISKSPFLRLELIPN